MNERDYNQDGSSQEIIVHNGNNYYTLEVTTRKTSLRSTLIERCVTFGIVNPVLEIEEAAWQEQGPFYSERDLQRLRRVRRLIQELGLNWAGVDIVMRLTDELEQLRAELAGRQRK